MTGSVGHQSLGFLLPSAVDAIVSRIALPSYNPEWGCVQQISACFHSATFAFLVVLNLGNAHAAEVSHIGIQQKVIVICVKFNDMTPKVASAADWVNRLDSAVNGYYHRATFGKTTFKFEFTTNAGRASNTPPMPSDGWFELPYDHTKATFVNTSETGRGVIQDAIDLADPYIDFTQYNRVLVIVATSHSSFGQAVGGWTYFEVDDGGEVTEVLPDGTTVSKRMMNAAFVFEGVALDRTSTIATHELGHTLGLKDLYQQVTFAPGYTVNATAPWTVMDGPWLSPPIHFLGWSKLNRNWIEAENCPIGNDCHVETVLWRHADVHLDEQENSPSGPARRQLVKIPFSNQGPGDPFIGYVVERRKAINGDEGIPQEGFLITLIDERPGSTTPAIVLDDPAEPRDRFKAPLRWTPTGSIPYVDREKNITISAMSPTMVRVEYPVPPSMLPDPAIRDWNAPPWETADIWIDSEKNGWDIYKYVDPSTNEPAGNGDDAWVGRDNRVYVRVRNSGQTPATNVKVRLYVNSPPGMGDAGPNWEPIEPYIVFPHIAPNAAAQNYVIWKPQVGEHTCVRAEIVEQPGGELTTGNNIARENVTNFETTQSSPWKPVILRSRVYNPSEKEETYVQLRARDLPEEWGFQIVPRETVLPPGGEADVVFTVYPGGPPNQPPSDRYAVGFLAKPKLEAWIPYGDSFILLGGVEAWTKLSEKTVIEIDRVDTEKDTVLISGRLVPATKGATVVVEFSRFKSREVAIAKTDGEGQFRVKTRLPVFGGWRVLAFFDGNDRLQSSVSKSAKIFLGN